MCRRWAAAARRFDPWRRQHGAARLALTGQGDGVDLMPHQARRLGGDRHGFRFVEGDAEATVCTMKPRMILPPAKV